MRSCLRLASLAVLVILVAGTTTVQASEIGIYYWPEDTELLKIEEDATDTPDAEGWYYWSYTVTNIGWTEDVTAWGYNIPDSVSFEYCGTPPTGWSTGATGYDVGWTGSDGYEITATMPAPGNQYHSVDNFFIRSQAPPHSIYTGTAVGSATTPGTLSGDISGPTPEPVTLGLLALGLPLGLLARRRKED